MVVLSDRVKKNIKKCKSELENNDLTGFYKKILNLLEGDDIGSVTEFLFECNIDVWQYVDIVMPYMFCMSNLETIDIPEGITKISQYAFAYSNVKTVNIAPTVKKIGNHAFVNCTNIKQLYLPESVVSIDANAFYDCENIKIRTPRRQVHNKLRLPKSEIDWYKQHLVFIDQSEEEE